MGSMDLEWWQMADAFAAWISPVCHTHFTGMPKAPSHQSTGHNLKSTCRPHWVALLFVPTSHISHSQLDLVTPRHGSRRPSRSSRVLTARDKRLCRPGHRRNPLTTPPDSQATENHGRMAWHVCEGPTRAGRKSAEASGITRANGARACTPEACLGLGRVGQVRSPEALSPDAQRFLGGAWIWRGLPCARCCTHGAAVAGGGATTSNASAGPDFPLWSPTPLCTHCPAHCPLPTPPTAPLAHPTLPQNHTLTTHTPIRPSPSSLPTFPLSPLFHPPPKPAALTTAHCSPRPCPGNSALHHHQPGP